MKVLAELVYVVFFTARLVGYLLLGFVLAMTAAAIWGAF